MDALAVPFVRLCSVLGWLLLFTSALYAGDEVSVGVQLFTNGHVREARRFFESLVQKQPDNPSGFFYVGRIAFGEQQYETAIENFEKAVELEEKNSDYHLWLGRAYGRQAERSSFFRQLLLARKVKLHLERAVELNPGNLPARADLREYYLRAPGFLGGSEEKAQEQAQEIAKREQRQAQP